MQSFILDVILKLFSHAIPARNRTIALVLH